MKLFQSISALNVFCLVLAFLFRHSSISTFGFDQDISEESDASSAAFEMYRYLSSTAAPPRASRFKFGLLVLISFTTQSLYKAIPLGYKWPILKPNNLLIKKMFLSCFSIFSTLWNYTVWIFSLLKWASNFLLYNSFAGVLYPCDVPLVKTCGGAAAVGGGEALGSTTARSAENVECAVCLCMIEAGEEVGDLRCSHGHFFHKACLDKWVVGFNGRTCPLCRGSLAPPLAPAQLGVEVLLIKLWSFRSADDDDDDVRETWWLR